MNIQNYNYSGMIQLKLPLNNSPIGDYNKSLSYNSHYSLLSDTVSFSGKVENRKKNKKIEETLKNIDGLHDPYSDVVMISQKKFKHFKNKLHKRTNAESMNNLMNAYTKHMFDSEKEVFELLKQGAAKYKKQNKSCTYTDILQDNLLAAKGKLINSQMDVVEKLNDYSKKHLTKQEYVIARNCLDAINDDIINDQFRIKHSRNMIRDLGNEIKNKEVINHLIKITDEFPNTATNSSAFIVKYANNSHEEIAELLISPSQISIEHIKPQSVRGEDKGANYLAASRRMNNYRRSTPLNEMIERYPNIPKQTQRYMDELISKINRGALPDIATTIPGVKDSLFVESKGLIDVDITKMKPQIFEEIDSFNGKIGKLVEHFKNNIKE